MVEHVEVLAPLQPWMSPPKVAPALKYPLCPMSIVPKWKPPLQSAVSVTVRVSSPEDGSVPCTSTLASTRSGDDVGLQALHRALTAGAGENVTTISSPSWARPACVPPEKVIVAATGVAAAEGDDGGLDPTAFTATTVKV